MSYLSLPRLTFAGLFEADVNTVNNDVRNYDSRVFEPRLQTSQQLLPDGNTEYNGWWNPNGSNAFRLLECAISGAVGPEGTAAKDDPVLRFRLDAQRDRTAAKIVDLDPQFQFASALWGLRIDLLSGEAPVMSATLMPSCFRDIYFGRLIDKATGKPPAGSASASARFTGTLTDVTWGQGFEASPLLRALKASADANEGRLHMSLMTYGYTKVPRDTQKFTLGSVIGSIGPWLKGEPLMFAPGRRFAPSANDPNALFASSSGLGYMTGAISANGKLLSLDLGNALPLTLTHQGTSPVQSTITVTDLGPLTVAVLKQADQVASGPQGLVMAPAAAWEDGLSSDRYEAIGVLSGYDMAWMQATGGIADLPIPDAAQALVGDHPLIVLMNAGAGVQTLAIRETTGGVWVRADDFVQRVDAAPTGWVNSTVSLYAMRYGKPWEGAPINVSVLPQASGQGGTDDENEVKPPQTTIPPINVPAEKVSLPARIVSGPGGLATLTYSVQDPQNVRGYIDGQIYQFGYSIAASGQPAMPAMEFIAVHVRDAFTPPQTPSWATDVQPVLVQYSNLYPIMSRGLFSFSDPTVLAANARLLRLAFTRPIEDPNYMPATRDLSAGKLRMIVDWLAGYLPDAPRDYGAIPSLPVGVTLPQPAAPVINDAHPSHVSAGAAATALEILGTGNDGKTAAVRSFLKNRPGRQ